MNIKIEKGSQWKIWQVISTIGGVLGLVSFAEDFYSWQPYIVNIIDQYRAIVHWPFKFLPFEIPSWIKDYLFFGSLVFGSKMKSNIRTPNGMRLFGGYSHMLVLVTSSFLLWPIDVMYRIVRYVITPNELRQLAIKFLENDESIYKSASENLDEFDVKFRNVLAYIYTKNIFIWTGIVLSLFTCILLGSLIWKWFKLNSI